MRECRKIREISHTTDIYSRIYLEKHLRMAFDNAYSDGMEEMLAILLDASVRDGNKPVEKFLSAFIHPVTALAYKHDLETPKTPRRYRMNMRRSL